MQADILTGGGRLCAWRARKVGSGRTLLSDQAMVLYPLMAARAHG